MDLVSARTAAKSLGVSHQTVLNWFESGKFPNGFKIERTVRIPLSDIEALKHTPKAQGA